MKTASLVKRAGGKIVAATMLNTTDKIIGHIAGLLNLAEDLSLRIKGLSGFDHVTDTFYRYQVALEDGGG